MTGSGSRVYWLRAQIADSSTSSRVSGSSGDLMAGFPVSPVERSHRTTPRGHAVAADLYRVGMANFDLVWVISITAGLLGLIITLLITYWVIRLAVTHALRSHVRWVSDGGDR